jgi:hypothetical protein
LNFGIPIKISPVQTLTGTEGHLNKQEAVLVLKEILATCKDSITIDWVSLDPIGALVSKNLESESGYLIKMKAGLDHYSRESVSCLLEKHGLEMKEQNGFVTISKIHP